MAGLERFLLAQDVTSENRGVKRFNIIQTNSYADALEEIRNGRKRGHWIWYIFPQLKGLGHSYNSNYYGIANIKEAIEYLNHPILGKRLREITEVLLSLPEGLTAREILGGIAARKVKSSMTLFYLASKETPFMDVINRYYDGNMDEQTIKMLSL